MLSIVYRKTKRMANTTTQNNRTNGNKYMEITLTTVTTVTTVMRMTSFVPLLLPHQTIRDTTLKGYHVPKKTTVFINQYRIHNNPKEWNEPKLFKPERFLDADGKFVGWTRTPAFLPFGIGRRACPGQDLGKMQVFLILSSLLHQFKLEMEDGEDVPSLVGDTAPGAIRCPKDYKVIARKRI